MRKLNITQASVTSLLIFVVGQVVAFVPSLSSEQQSIIATGTLVIACVFALVHTAVAVVDLVRELIASKQKLTVSEIEGDVRALAKDELAKFNLGGLAQDAISGQNVPQLVADEVGRQFADFIRRGQNAAAPAVPAAPPPPAVPPAA